MRSRKIRAALIHCALIFVLTLVLGAGCASTKSAQRRHFDSLEILGTPQFAGQVVPALELLKTKSPRAYNMVTNQIGIIRQFPHSGMEADHHPPIFDLGDRSAAYSATWLAGAIAHDSYHSKLYHDYLKTHQSVPDEIWTGPDAEKKCLAHQVQTLMDIGAPETEINYCKSIPPGYADIPYQKRNW